MSVDFRRPLTAKRTGSGSYVAGMWTEGLQTEFEILASVQPASPTDMQMLPAGRRSQFAFKLFTNTQLFTADKLQNADRVVINGEEYTVVVSNSWQNFMPHYQVLVTRNPDA